MNRQLTPDEISKLDVPTMPPMSRREKLLRWASLVRRVDGPGFVIFHGLEYVPPERLDPLPVPHGSAFAVAIADPVFCEAGLGCTMGDNMRFFELSQADLHEFSCDCGGAISNAAMADRIEAIANRGLVNGIRRAFAHW